MWEPNNIVKQGRGEGAAAANKPNVTMVRSEDVLARPTRDANGVKMTGDYVLKPGAKMFTVYMTPSKQVKNYTTDGDEDMETIKQKFEGSIPGDQLAAAEFVQNMMGVDVEIIAANCVDAYKRVYGTPCSPMKLKAEQTDDSSGRMTKLVFEQIVGSKYVPAFYEGNLVYGAPTASDESVDVTVANGEQYQLEAFALGETIDIASTDRVAGDVITFIGGGGADPGAVSTGDHTAAKVLLVDGTDWTALEDATITFKVFDDGTDTYFIEQNRT